MRCRRGWVRLRLRRYGRGRLRRRGHDSSASCCKTSNGDWEIHSWTSDEAIRATEKEIGRTTNIDKRAIRRRKECWRSKQV